jgi:hypothetical protein
VTRGRFGEGLDAAIALIDLALNPSFADGWYWSWLDEARAIIHGTDPDAFGSSGRLSG